MYVWGVWYPKTQRKSGSKSFELCSAYLHCDIINALWAIKNISWLFIDMALPSVQTYGVFFSTKIYAFYLKKNAILCLFLKNVSPSKTVVCFILNNSHLPMVQGIAFCALYDSWLLIISCTADDFCLFKGLPDEI